MSAHVVSVVAARFDAVSRWLAVVVVRLMPIVVGAFSDLIVLAGVAAIAYGLSLWSKPCAWIFVGITAITIGVRGSLPPPRPRGEA